MWTQIERTSLVHPYSGMYNPNFPFPLPSIFPPTYLSSSHIEVTNSLGSTPVSIEVGNWLVISPYSPDSPDIFTCEIRKVIAVTPNTHSYDVEVSPALNYDHAVDDTVYVQTSPNWDILLFGAREDDSSGSHATINTRAINLALIDAIYCSQYSFNGSYQDLSGAIVSIPKGTYLVERNSTTDNWALNVYQGNNIKIVGEGIDVSIIRRDVSSDTDSLDIFNIQNEQGVSLIDLTIDGNGTMSIANASTCAFFKGSNFQINRVSFINSFGHGIHLEAVSNMSVLNCFFFALNRNSIDFINYTNYNNIFCNNTFKNNWGNDINIYSDGSYMYFKSIIIAENIFENDNGNDKNFIYVSFDDAVGNTAYIDGLEVVKNIFTNGGAYFENCWNFVFSENIVTNNDLTTTVNTLLFTKNCRNIVFSNNVISNNLNDFSIIHFVSYDTSTIHLTIDGLIINGNSFQNYECEFHNIKDIIYSNNILRRTNDTSPFPLSFLSIFYLTQNSTIYDSNWADYGNLMITGNQFSGNSYEGIKLDKGIAPLAQYNIIDIASNCIGQVLNYGINITNYLGTIAYWNRLMIVTSNIINDIPYNVSNNYESICCCASYMIEENPSQEVWISVGNPNGFIDAPQGSIAIDNTIEADNKYQKNSLSGTDGWMLVSELDKQLLIREYFQNQGTTPYDLTSQNNTGPNVNVFFPTSGANMHWEFDPGIPTNAWQINNSEGEPTGQYNAFINTASGTPSTPVSNGIIKAVFRCGVPSSANHGAGITFRHNGLNLGKFFSYYIKGSTTPGLYDLILMKLDNGTLTSLFSTLVN